MKFAILTGGGDSPGMNAFVRAVVRSSLNLNPSTSVWGVIDGWRGAIDSNFKKLGKREMAGIAHTGGTILGTLRAPELKDNIDAQEGVALNLHDNNFDYLFVIGGNGSLKAAETVNKIIVSRGLRTKILVAAGSIDNDVCNNFGYSIGFYSAIDKSLEMLEWIRDTASAHRRVYIIESMGRDSGYLAFFAGIATGAEYVIRPGENVDYEKMANMINERDRDSRIIVSEGYDKSIEDVRIILEEIFTKRGVNHEIRTVDMGYFQRGGKAAVQDILHASWLAHSMVKCAFNHCESGFYTGYNIGHPPTVLSLEEAIDDENSTHYNLPKEIIEFAIALR
ncbi:MAG: 6-phosphofructokinase [Ignavibacteria bacterium]|nr:6-phosphofructokinase [Ignavibacteria bacterium]